MLAASLAALLFVVLASVVMLFGYTRYVRPSLIIDRLAQEVDRLSDVEPSTLAPAKSSPWVAVVSAVGAFLPLDVAARSLAKRQLSAAGFRSESAVVVFSGIRLLSAAIFLVVALLLRDHVTQTPLFRIGIIIAGCAAGYVLPGFVLAKLIGGRRQAIRLALPDALDLLVVCTDAGCALDQAIVNVSRELRDVHPALCEELSMVSFEIVAGSPRSDALHSLGERTGEEDLKKLVSVLVQTDRFGTSISEALRTQSDFMRIRRRQIAEEKAGKVGVKLVFPIFFFCMPSLLIVTAGPGLLQLFKNLLPAIKEFH